MFDKRGLIQLGKVLAFEINKAGCVRPSRPFSNLWKVPQRSLSKEISERLNMTSCLSSSTSLNDIPNVNCSEDNIVWIDMEMTGLEVDKDHILEVACLVTDSKLNVIAEGPNLVIHQHDDVLKNMNEWSLKQHAESGLTIRCKESKVSLKEAENELLNFVRKWTPYKQCPLGGNTVYIDRYFLMKHMPEFEQHMLYRIVDVSSIKELCRRWYPEIYREQPNKKDMSKHRALDDIRASIEELKFYKGNIFKKPEMGESMTSVTWY